MQGQSNVRASTPLAPLAGRWCIDKNGQHRNNTHIDVHEMLSRYVGAKLYFFGFCKQQVVNTCREHFVSVRELQMVPRYGEKSRVIRTSNFEYGFVSGTRPHGNTKIVPH